MTQSMEHLRDSLTRLGDAARRHKDLQFNNLLHHITLDCLSQAFYHLNKQAAKGVDEQDWHSYAEGLAQHLPRLHQQVQSGRYRAQAIKRVWIPKADGSQRPIGITSIEDKIVQQAVVWVLEAIYEQDFLGFSYGFRPNRSQHQALDAVYMAISVKKVGWIIDADLKAFFDTLNHDWMMRFLEHRIADRRVLRLIKGWLTAKVQDGKQSQKSSLGTPQGGVISPLLANIYLHYVLDLWLQQWRKRRSRGDVYIVRYADDFIIGCQYRDDADGLLHAIKQRFAKFALSLNEQKTKLIEFGRFAGQNRAQRGQSKPDTFDFLGFTHACGEALSSGKFMLKRYTIKKKARAFLARVKAFIRNGICYSPYAVGNKLKQILTGYFNYFAIPGNQACIGMIRTEVCKYWLRTLRRRSQKGRTFNWQRLKGLVMLFIPHTRVRHPYPNQRLKVI